MEAFLDFLLETPRNMYILLCPVVFLIQVALPYGWRCDVMCPSSHVILPWCWSCVLNAAHPTAYNLVPWTKGVMGWSTRGSWHPGRWTAGTYSPQPWKERKLIWTKPPGNYVPAVNLQGSLNYIKLPIFWEIEQCKCIWYSYFLSIVWIGDWN